MLQRQVQAKILGKRDKGQEEECKGWINAVLEKDVFGGSVYEDVLKDGQVLCQLMNKIAPGSIPKINSSGGPYKLMENINNFQAALKKYGVADIDVFQTVDLFEKKDIAMVTTTIMSLGRTTYKHAEYNGPKLGPKPSEENKREFDEATLRAGEGIIGLQAGQNKGATQSGQNFGNARHIIQNK